MLTPDIAAAVVRVAQAFSCVDLDIGGGYYRLSAPRRPGAPWLLAWARSGDSPRVIASASTDADAVELAARLLPRGAPITLTPRG